MSRSSPPVLWAPSSELVESARLTEYMRWLDRGFSGYRELWAGSVSDVEGFWASLWEFFGVRASRPYERVLSSHAMPGARWFEGAELSYAGSGTMGLGGRLQRFRCPCER